MNRKVKAFKQAVFLSE